METFGQQVARARKQRSWTQKDLADKSGVKLRTIQDVEGDKHQNPQRDTRLRLQKALDLPGDPEQERSDWDPDVKVILDITGAFLMTLNPDARLEWLRGQNIVGGAPS
jgi:transcriptional regulator with XRE-family HTH domain